MEFVFGTEVAPNQYANEGNVNNYLSKGLLV
jgi:hypothetical protein